MAINLKRVLGPTVIVLCCIGVIVQIGFVSQRHFQYRTRTVVGMVITTEIKFPEMSVCFKTMDVLNFTAISAVYPSLNLIRWNDVKNFRWDDYFNYSSQFTVSELFSFTPANDKLLQNSFSRDDEACLIVIPGNFRTKGFGVDECYKKFKVTKYLMREFVCYRFTPNFNSEKLRIAEYTMPPDYASVFYKVSIQYISHFSYSMS